MAPPELQLINQVWNGSQLNLGCAAWHASGTSEWVPLTRENPEFSEPEICDGKIMAACTHTAFFVGKLLSATSTSGGMISFNLNWTDPGKGALVSVDQVEQVFSQVNKVFMVKVDLSNQKSHSFVVTSYNSGAAHTLCCGLYMSYATGVGGNGYSLSGFLNGKLNYVPKMDQDIPMTSFTDTFEMLYKPANFQEVWKTLFGCEEPSTQLQEVRVKVLDRTTLSQTDILQKIKQQWTQCPHGNAVGDISNKKLT